MPVTYRSHVAPRFTSWVADGYRRLHDHKAMAAGRVLAEQCLNYTYVPDPNVARVQGWTEASNVMRELRQHGVTPEQLMLRVAELVAFFDAEPHRCPGQVAENMALGSAVAHLVRWNGPGRGQSKRMKLAVAEHLREQGVAGWAIAFVRRLRADQEKVGDLMRQALKFD